MNNVIRIASRLTIPALILVLLLFIHEKKNFHMDEISSYIGANNAQDTSISLHPQFGFRYDEAASPWLSQMTVSEGRAFDYAQVRAIQAADVHPPLYYALLHTLCSFVPGVFSKWFAGLINILFSLLTLLTVRRMTKMMTESETAVLLVSAVYVLSAGLISAATYFRMYVMLMFFLTLFSFLMMQSVLREGNLPVHRYVAAGLTALGAMLTQYYAVFFLTAAVLVCLTLMIIKKEFRKAVLLCLSMIVSAVLFFVLFPASLTQMRSTGHGANTLALFSGGFSDAGDRAGVAAGILDEQLFGGIAWLPLAACLIALGLRFVQKRKGTSFACAPDGADGAPARHGFRAWMIPLIAVIVYVVFTAQAAPYLTPRYYYPVYALILTMAVCALLSALRRVCGGRTAFLLSAAVFAVTCLMHFRSNIHYLYRSTQPLLETASAYAETDCICIARHSYDLNAAFLEVSRYNSVTFFSADDLTGLEQAGPDLSHGLMVVIGEGCDAALAEESVREAFPVLGEAQYLGGHGGAQTFYYAGGE